MSAIVEMPVTMTSSEIAKLVESRHDKVKQSIERLAAKGVIVQPPMGDEHGFDALGRPRTTEVYLFAGEQGKRDSIVVVAQLSPEFTAALVDRWQELEAKQAAVALPTDYITALEHLLESKRAEQAAIAERDHAIATKAQIGGKREATAMATASAANRKARQLEEELGRGIRHATIVAVEKASGCKFGTQGFRPLQKWCKAHGVTPPKVPCPRYGEATSWPADAWREVYGIDLGELFGGVVMA
ncbi:ORF6N domain-containing protein [Azotobacter chroococcum subsp. isscasi]|uniref:Rha family transcriptional regulator n=1 Tax=Azotobacter chroococcum TaxID=353 RepID=UPI00103D8772|nr:Rha family transcriptional regulator [Azotobacter chroococcum]TBW11698.1 ORF6N domain-containing protein [Azotobacter chroococcum subsp. isscasi]